MSSMMFWGVEVKAGETLKVTPEDDFILHLSQAALGESKKSKNESVPLYVTVDGKKLVLGTLSAEKFPQVQFDLVFEKEFELSHNWKSGSVYFSGYKSVLPDEEDEYSEFDSEDDEDIPMTAVENGKVEKAKPAPAKAATAKPEASKPKAKLVVPAKPDVESDDDDEDDSDDDEDDEDESGDDESGEEMSIEGDDSEDEDDSEEEETPKKPESGKKRANGSAIKTPVSNKKAKAAAVTTTPQKTDGKKAGGHTDTPHPAKKEGKSAAKPQTPKSVGSVSCGSCDRKFVSEAAMQSHAKAKHSAAK